MKGASSDRRKVVEDAIDSQHLPLDVDSWDDLNVRYFKEFAPHLFYNDYDAMGRAFKRLFEKWLDEHPELGMLATDD